MLIFFYYFAFVYFSLFCILFGSCGSEMSAQVKRYNDETEERRFDREEARLRREEREEARREEREEARLKREAIEDERRNLFQIAMIQALRGYFRYYNNGNLNEIITGNGLGDVGAGGGRVISGNLPQSNSISGIAEGSQSTTGTITVYDETANDDSEKFPTVVAIGDKEQFDKSLHEIIGVNKPLILIVDRKRVYDSKLIPDGKSYSMKYIVKEDRIKVYMESIE